MIRPMTSNVSTLSGCVANGDQAIHFVSSAPSKIPYGGFSPVRLQTRFRQRPPSRANDRPLIGRHCRYLVSRSFVRSGSCDQAAPRTSDHDRGSSGPWLPVRLFSPNRSLLTMATSETLTLRIGLWIIPTRPRTPEVPQFTPRVFWYRVVSRTPAVFLAAHNCFFTMNAGFAAFAPARQPHWQTPPVWVRTV